jgi:dTDP-4-amino-4,6-dideoxygalactose transaminase
MLVLHWLGVGAGDEVIIPAYTYCATALAVMHVGATPVMVDVEDDFNLSVEHTRAAITSKTKAIIPVDFAGWPCDYDGFFSLVNEPGIKQLFIAKGEVQQALGRIAIVADAAHSFGAIYKNKRTGSLADITVFSFHAVKNLTTAEGGAVCLTLPAPFKNSEVYRTLRLWTLNGQTKDAFSKSQAGSWRYDIVYPGFKMNMPDVCAAIGLAQIKKYDDEMLSARKRVFEFYDNAFSEMDWALLPPYTKGGCACSYHLYPLRVLHVDEQQRDSIIQLISEKGVAANVHFIPLPMLSVFKCKGFDIENYPTAYRNYAMEISLPIYPQLDNNLCKYIVNTVSDAVSQVCTYGCDTIS